MERRGFFRSLLGLAALPFVPVEKLVQAFKPRPSFVVHWGSVETIRMNWSNAGFGSSGSNVISSSFEFQDTEPQPVAKEDTFWTDATLEDIK